MRTLNANEVEAVSGGWIFVPVVVAAARCAASTQCRTAVAAVGAGVGFVVTLEALSD